MARTSSGRLIGRAAAEDLRDERIYWAEMAEKQASELKSQFQAALAELQMLDPIGWEPWYDNDANVPDWKGWGNCQPAVTALRNRCNELRVIASSSSKNQHLAWRVLEPSTLRAYELAGHDFSQITGKPMQSATLETVESWLASMRARKFSINTIRQRLSALRTISGIKIELPKRPKTDRTIMNAKQVRALMAVVSDRSDRMLLVRLLTLGTTARTVQEPAFMSHFLGAEQEHTLATQKVTRVLKRYAGKAGLNAKQVSLRVWCLSGRRLVETLAPVELSELLSARVDQEPCQVVEPKLLHGINRRSQVKA